MQWIKSGGIFNVWNVSSVQNGYFEFRKAGDGAVELVLSCSSWNAALTLEPVPHVRLSCAYFQMTEKGGKGEAADQKRTAEFCLFKFCVLPERSLMRSLCISLPTQLPRPPRLKWRYSKAVLRQVLGLDWTRTGFLSKELPVAGRGPLWLTRHSGPLTLERMEPLPAPSLESVGHTGGVLEVPGLY